MWWEKKSIKKKIIYIKINAVPIERSIDDYIRYLMCFRYVLNVKSIG